jgi:hypothetical protein
MGMIAIVAIIAVAAVAAFLLVRRRKRSALKSKLQFSKQNGGSDIESVLDSQLRKPEESK